MTKQEIIARLESLGKDRQWLSEAIGYSYDYVKNSLAPGAPEPSPKFYTLAERAFSEEERRADVSLSAPDASVWDLVFFSGREMTTIDRAKKAGGYDDLPSFYRDAVLDFASRLEPAELAPNITPMIAALPDHQGDIVRVPFGGGVAAGEPAEAAVSNETYPLDHELPAGHYLLRVHGTSMEPTILDGALIEVRRLKNGEYPKQKNIVVYNDGGGATLKRLAYRAPKHGEDEPVNTFGKVAVLRADNPAFTEVQTMETGKITAVYVSTV